MSLDQPWIVEAKKLISTKEMPGPGNNPVIVGWLRKLGAWWFDDATPWCGVFVAHCFKTALLTVQLPQNWMRAKSWETWGLPLAQPCAGCVVTFTREGGGHVGFVLGVTPDGFLAVLGGNQSDAVNILKFPKTRATSYRWPFGVPMNPHLPVLTILGGVSIKED